ncbi:MAG: hypothetical protein IKD04_05915 [Clostridia bacterium]|nr:hypothetical protein [Clostridia bacterium]
MLRKTIAIFFIACFIGILSGCELQTRYDEVEYQSIESQPNTEPQPDGKWDRILLNCDDKYFVVERTVETYNSVTCEIGVVDINNTFISPLSSTNILVGKSNLCYLGDGVVIASEGVVVQKEDGSSFVVGRINARGETTHFYNIEEDKGFSVKADVISTVIEGYIITEQVSRDCYRVTDTGTEQIDFVSKLGPYSDGLFYGQPEGGFPQGYYFYDINGIPIIDMSEYDIEIEDMKTIKFEDGLCTFEFKNPSGNTYSATIDKSGNFIIEPYKK